MSTPAGSASGPAPRPTPPPATRVLSLDEAGDDRSAWVTMLTTEHYGLQGMRSATITEANGRASVFLGAMSAGLIALGFAGGGRGGAATVFQVVVLTGLTFLGLATFLRCLEISIDDWEFSTRIARLRATYQELAPPLGDVLRSVAGPEQATSMLSRRLQPFQIMLSVAGTLGVLTAMLLGADLGALLYGVRVPLGMAVAAGVLAFLAGVAWTMRFQTARWRGAYGAREQPLPV